MTMTNTKLEKTQLGVTVDSVGKGKVLITFDQAILAIELSAEDAQDFALNILDAVEGTKSRNPPGSN